jgi:hypothetical protein
VSNSDISLVGTSKDGKVGKIGERDGKGSCQPERAAYKKIVENY